MGGWVHGWLGWPIYVFWMGMAGLGIALGHLFDRSGALAARALGGCWGHGMWATLPFWRRHWEGLDRIGAGPYIIVSNHQSVIDIPCLFGLPLPVRISARPGIFRVRGMGLFLRWSQQVDTEHFMDNAAAALQGGFSVVVFPEGSRSADGRVGRFRRGAFELSKRTGVPILPVAMDGAQYILSKRDFFPTRWIVHVHAHVLPPQMPEDDTKSFAQRTRLLVAEEVARIRGNP